MTFVLPENHKTQNLKYLKQYCTELKNASNFQQITNQLNIIHR